MGGALCNRWSGNKAVSKKWLKQTGQNCYTQRNDKLVTHYKNMESLGDWLCKKTVWVNILLNLHGVFREDDRRTDGPNQCRNEFHQDNKMLIPIQHSIEEIQTKKIQEIQEYSKTQTDTMEAKK